MKAKFCLIVGLISYISFGQSNDLKTTGSSKIIVENLIEDNSQNNEIALFINRKQYHKSLLRTIKPEIIENYEVKPDSKNYPNGAVELTINNNIIIKPISIKDLLENQTSHKALNNVYFIEDQLIEEKSSNYYVDENNIFRIVIKPIKNADLQYNLIKIYTKSDKNINDYKNRK